MTFIKHTVRTATNNLEEKANQCADLAIAKGLIFGEVVGAGYGKPALSGNTFAVKEVLKENGAKFNGADKCRTFENKDQVLKALSEI